MDEAKPYFNANITPIEGGKYKLDAYFWTPTVQIRLIKTGLATLVLADTESVKFYKAMITYTGVTPKLDDCGVRAASISTRNFDPK